jgi:hypothetical protein
MSDGKMKKKKKLNHLHILTLYESLTKFLHVRLYRIHMKRGTPLSDEYIISESA